MERATAWWGEHLRSLTGSRAKALVALLLGAGLLAGVVQTSAASQARRRQIRTLPVLARAPRRPATSARAGTGSARRPICLGCG